MVDHGVGTAQSLPAHRAKRMLPQKGNPRLAPLRPVHAPMLAHKITPLNFPETVRKGAHAVMGLCAPEIRFPPSPLSSPLHAHVATMPQDTKKAHPEQVSDALDDSSQVKQKGPRNVPRAHKLLSGYFIYLHHQYQATRQLSDLFPN